MLVLYLYIPFLYRAHCYMNSCFIFFLQLAHCMVTCFYWQIVMWFYTFLVSMIHLN